MNENYNNEMEDRQEYFEHSGCGCIVVGCLVMMIFALAAGLMLFCR